jgi:hypothetical protein
MPVLDLSPSLSWHLLTRKSLILPTSLLDLYMTSVVSSNESLCTGNLGC